MSILESIGAHAKDLLEDRRARIAAAAAAAGFLVYFAFERRARAAAPIHVSKSSHPIGKAAEALASIGHPDASPMPMLDVQRKLNYLGFGPLPETGTKDAATTKAIKDFQSKVNLTIDGIVGPKTSAAIRTAIDEKNRSELGKTQDIALLAPPDTATAPSDPFLPSDLSSAIAATEGATGVSGWWR